MQVFKVGGAVRDRLFWVLRIGNIPSLLTCWVPQRQHGRFRLVASSSAA